MSRTGIDAFVLLQQVPTAEEELAALIVSLVFLGLILLVVMVLGVWIYRDARRRGHNPILWALGWQGVPILGLVLFLVGTSTGRTTEGAVAYATWLVIAGSVVLIVWLTTRPVEILFDAEGRPIHPQALKGASAWSFVPGEPPPSHAPPRPLAPPGPAPPFFGPPMASVRCPECQLVFGYTRAAVGRTRVVCPNCRLSGVI